MCQSASQIQSLGVTENDKCETEFSQGCFNTRDLLYHDNYTINVKYCFKYLTKNTPILFTSMMAKISGTLQWPYEGTSLLGEVEAPEAQSSGLEGGGFF